MMIFYLSRPLPSCFNIRTATIRKKSDGWHIAVLLEDQSVPNVPAIDTSLVRKAIGVDLGINKLASLSSGTFVENPRFSQKVERRRNALQRKAQRKRKGSRKRAKAYQCLQRLEQKVANRRSDNQWKVANKLVKSADAIILEDLNIRGMMARCKPKQDEKGKYLKNGQSAKSGLNKAIADAAWGDLKLKVKAVAEKSGVIFLEVDPKHTSQHCSECGHTSASNRDKEKFLCTECGYCEDADTQASKNILERGLKLLGISQSQLCGVPAKVRPLAVGGSADLSKVAGTPKKPVERQGKPVGLPAGSGNPRQYKQLSLFEWRHGQAIVYPESPSIAQA